MMHSHNELTERSINDQSVVVHSTPQRFVSAHNALLDVRERINHMLEKLTGQSTPCDPVKPEVSCTPPLAEILRQHPDAQEEVCKEIHVILNQLDQVLD